MHGTRSRAGLGEERGAGAGEGGERNGEPDGQGAGEAHGQHGRAGRGVQRNALSQ